MSGMWVVAIVNVLAITHALSFVAGARNACGDESAAVLGFLCIASLIFWVGVAVTVMVSA